MDIHILKIKNNNLSRFKSLFCEAVFVSPRPPTTKYIYLGSIIKWNINIHCKHSRSVDTASNSEANKPGLPFRLPGLTFSHIEWNIKLYNAWNRIKCEMKCEVEWRGNTTRSGSRVVILMSRLLGQSHLWARCTRHQAIGSWTSQRDGRMGKIVN